MLLGMTKPIKLSAESPMLLSCSYRCELGIRWAAFDNLDRLHRTFAFHMPFDTCMIRASPQKLLVISLMIGQMEPLSFLPTLHIDISHSRASISTTVPDPS